MYFAHLPHPLLPRMPCPPALAQTGGADEFVRWAEQGLAHEAFFTDERAKVRGDPALPASQPGGSTRRAFPSLPCAAASPADTLLPQPNPMRPLRAPRRPKMIN